MNAMLKRAPLRAVVSVDHSPLPAVSPRDPHFLALLSCGHHRPLQLRRFSPVHCIACLVEAQEAA